MINQKVQFGPSGNDENFYNAGNKSSLEAIAYIKNKNCETYEYGFTRGVKKSQEASNKKLGEECKKQNISLSVHAPYYINFATTDEQKRQNSIGYILQAYEQGVQVMGADRIVFHPGSLEKASREDAFKRTKQALQELANVLNKQRAEQNDTSTFHLCVETMGKHGQVGTVDEVLELCQVDKMFMPCLDFGHINSYTLGGLKTKQDFLEILNKVKNAFDDERATNLHIHFSKIKYGEKGELAHLKFEEQGEPNPQTFCEALLESGMNARVVCESKGSQMDDAETLFKLFNQKQ